MTPKPAPIPQVPAALCGLYPGAHVIDPDDPDLSKMLVVAQIGESGYSLLNRYNAVYPANVATLSLLLDSPLAMCHAARWLATRLGMDPGETAPWWTPYPRGVFCPGDNDPNRPDFWVLCCSTGDVLWFVDADEPDDMRVDQDGNRYISVAGLKSASNPAEALAAACVAVGGAS